MRSPTFPVLGLSLALLSLAPGQAVAGVMVPCALVCPSDPTVIAESGDAAVVSFADPVLEGDGCADEFPTGATIACTPQSGSSFPVGDTAVSCTTNEGFNGRSFPCSFTVTVLAQGCDVVAPDCDEGGAQDCEEVVSPDCDAGDELER